MQTTINQPKQKLGKERQQHVYPDYPITIVPEKKGVNRMTVKFILVLCLMAGVIMMSVQSGNLFLKELIVSSSIILTVMFLKILESKSSE